ncbi:MAG: hypothetical protein ABW167_07820 [Baekduia sp.]
MPAGQHIIAWEVIPGHSHVGLQVARGWFCSLCGRLNRVGQRADADRMRLRSDLGFMTVSRSGRAAPPHCTGCGVAVFVSEMADAGYGIYGAMRFGVDPRGRWQ